MNNQNRIVVLDTKVSYALCEVVFGKLYDVFDCDGHLTIIDDVGDHVGVNEWLDCPATSIVNVWG